MTKEEIIAELDAIEAKPKKCLPDPICTCKVCERYCELWGMLDEIVGQESS